jgi:DNA repair exonuclease SbcCD ATPase subunit
MGEDGLKEYEFEMDGNIYISRILINATKKKSIAEFYKNGKLLNDKKEEYDAHVVDAVGEYDLFINSVFAPQTTELILTMKDTPMKNLFMMLFNLEKYSNVYLPLLKLRKDDTEKRLQGVRSAYDVLSEDIEEMESKRKELIRLEAEIPKMKIRVEADKEALDDHLALIVKTKQELTKITIENESLKDKKRQSAALQKDIDSIAGDIAKEAKELEVSLKSNQSEYDLAVSDKSSMDREINRANKIINNKKLILEKVDRLNELKTGLESVSAAEKELLYRKDEFENIKDEIKNLLEEIEILDRVPCKGLAIAAQCELLSKAYGSKDKVYEKEKEKVAKSLMIKRLEDDKSLAVSISKEIEELSKDDWISIKSELNLAEKSITGWESRLKKSEERIIECAKVKEALEKKLDGLEKKALDKTKDKKTQRAEIEKEIAKMEGDERIAGLEAEIKRLEFHTLKVENEYNVGNNDLITAQTLIKQYTEDVELLKRKEESKKIKVKEMNQHINDLEEWNILEKFFKETPVLELESLSQITTDFANELIRLYSDSFSTKIVTVLPKSGNKGFKDVFKIVVYNNGKEILAQNLSGGQKQVFDAVLRMAIVLTLGTAQKRKFLSSFWDEAASAIDSEYAIKYMEMHEKALQLSDKHFTFLISHHEKTQGMIDQKILVENL